MLNLFISTLEKNFDYMHKFESNKKKLNTPMNAYRNSL